MIERLADGGVVVSGGHTAMTPDDLAGACDVGLSYATHLFNAMAPFNHRSPGPIGAVLAHDTLVAGVICDGIHVDPIAVRMAWHALGPTRMSLVSDASPALGMPYGRMQLAGFEIIHDETGVRTVDGVLRRQRTRARSSGAQPHRVRRLRPRATRSPRSRRHPPTCWDSPTAADSVSAPAPT